MSSHRIAFLLLLVLVAPVSATYAGDKPLSITFMTEDPASASFSTGNSTYGGVIEPGETYTVSLPYTIPPDAEVLYDRIYLYWSWSRIGQDAIYPALHIEADGVPLELVDRYTDSKGFVAANDFFSGMDTYRLPVIPEGSGAIVVRCTNTAPDERTLVMMGGGLLTISSSPSDAPGILWVAEGCDMLYATHGITPSMATTAVTFEGEVRRRDTRSADLLLVAPSGGYTRHEIPQKNAVYFNRDRGSNLPGFIESVLSAIFPGYNGKVWYDAFVADEINQIGIDTRDVRPYLRNSGNMVQVQDRGDYLTVTNAILDIRYGGA